MVKSTSKLAYKSVGTQIIQLIVKNIIRKYIIDFIENVNVKSKIFCQSNAC